jgi:hypothetical protein
VLTCDSQPLVSRNKCWHGILSSQCQGISVGLGWVLSPQCQGIITTYALVGSVWYKSVFYLLINHRLADLF